MMKKFSERGQGVLVLVLLGALVIAVVYFGFLANQRGIQKGAETIGEAVGNAIDNAGEAQTYFAWKGTQTLYPNKHAMKQHGQDAHDSGPRC